MTEPLSFWFGVTTGLVVAWVFPMAILILSVVGARGVRRLRDRMQRRTSGMQVIR